MDKYAYGDVHVYIQRIIDPCKDTYKFHSSEDEAELVVAIHKYKKWRQKTYCSIVALIRSLAEAVVQYTQPQICNPFQH